MDTVRLAMWVVGAVAVLALLAVVLRHELYMSVTEAVQAAGSGVLILVTVVYVRATQDLVALDRARRETEIALRRVEVARATRHSLRALERHLNRIAELTISDTLDGTLQAIRGDAVAREIAGARECVDAVYDVCSSVVDDDVSDEYTGGGSEAAEYADRWLDLLSLIRQTSGTDLDVIWGANRKPGALPGMIRGEAYDGKPAASDAEGLQSGKWARTASQAVFNAWDAMTTYIDNRALRDWAPEPHPARRPGGAQRRP